MNSNSYILLGWPESQPWLGKRKCIPGEDQSVFVPADLYEKKTPAKQRAEEMLKGFRNSSNALREFIAKNVPVTGIKLTKKEIAEQTLRIDFCEHFTGETGRLNVTHIEKYNVKGIDDYNNEVDRCSIASDLCADSVYEIAWFLFYYRNKSKI